MSKGFPTEIINEGKAKLIVPKLDESSGEPIQHLRSEAPVFYNPVMKTNRDTAVLMLRVYQNITNHPVTVCEPMTGSGVRGIRLLLEAHEIDNMVLGDLSPSALRLARGVLDPPRGAAHARARRLRRDRGGLAVGLALRRAALRTVRRARTRRRALRIGGRLHDDGLHDADAHSWGERRFKGCGGDRSAVGHHRAGVPESAGCRLPSWSLCRGQTTE